MLKENDIISFVLLTINRYKGNLSLLKNGVADNEYIPENCKYFTRTLVWKSCLITNTLNIQTWESRLSNTRIVFHQLSKQDDMIPPWHELDSDNVFYRAKTKCKKSVSRSKSVVRRSKVLKTNLARESNVINPLENQENVSVERQPGDLDLLQAIIVDIDRLFPGEEFFSISNPSSIESKRQLIQILFVWCKCNSHISYKQGFHEILGLIYINLFKESIEIPNTNTISADDKKILSLYDKHYLSHDLFTIFNKFMFESGIITQFYENETALTKSIELFNSNLMKVDQLIHYNLISKLKVESQLWIIRYLRLVLLRELDNDLESTNLLWDKLICTRLDSHSKDSTNSIPQVLMFIIIVMLIQLKTELITCDFSESLSLLLHYPITSRSSKGNAFINELYKDAVKLCNRVSNDLKLYEYGIKLNKKFNPNLKVSMIYNGPPRESSDSLKSATISPISSTLGNNSPVDQKVENLKFEKLRLEMRLKKRAQQLMSP